MTYSENVVCPSGELLPGRRHQAGLGVDVELPVFVSVHDAVGELCIRAVVSIVGEDTVDSSASLSPPTLGQTRLIELLWENGFVIVYIQDLNHHPDGGVTGQGSSI